MERGEQQITRLTLKNRGAAGKRLTGQVGSPGVANGTQNGDHSRLYRFERMSRVGIFKVGSYPGIPVLGCDCFTVILASLRGDMEIPKVLLSCSKCYSGLRITPR